MKKKKPENGDGKSGEIKNQKISNFLKRRQIRYLLATVVVLMSLVVLVLVFAFWMYKITENSCYVDL